MIAYAFRRIMLMIPTLLAIMVVNFFIVQAAPGGPMEQMIARLKGNEIAATERITGGASGDIKGSPSTGEAQYRGARGLDPAFIKELEKQYGYYVIPNFHLSAFWVAYWDKFRRPEISPKYGVGLDTWWVDPKAEQTIEAKKGEAAK